MRVPYAKCDFAAIRAEGYFYVDKTMYIPQLEGINESHLIFLRPRRFGKSTLIRTLELYYDINKASEFDTLFGGLWIHQHPTPNRNKYLVLTLDLSPVDTVGDIKAICRSFAVQVKGAVGSFLHQYRGLVPALSRLIPVVESNDEDMAGLMTQVLTILKDAGHQMYLFIDEYDHFGNRLLSDDRKTTYDELVKASGFVRSFYASIKAFTRASVIARTFITGVSPIMLDDLSSGFNIITHISHDPTFNALAGFTHADVELALDTLLHDMPELAKDPRVGNREQLLGTLARYYDGYRFSPYATERLYNSTLVLYFLSQLTRYKHFPRKMLDLNVRTDYGRLYQIAKSTSEKNSDIRDLLEDALTKKVVKTPLVEQFGTKLHIGRAQVASLFFYMGMLTFADGPQSSNHARLVIPNRVMRELQWEYMSFALAEHDQIDLPVSGLWLAMNTLAETGEIQPLLDVFHKEVILRLGLLETITFNEQTMKLMLLAYLSLSGSFYLMTEVESAQGYCDLLLALRGDDPDAQYAWILEAKYVKTDQKKDDLESAINTAFRDGMKQVEKYTSDQRLIPLLTQGKSLKAGVLVFVGLKEIRYKPWPGSVDPSVTSPASTGA